MGKGFNSNARKKQADLAKKMELAKKQNEDPENESILSVKETTTKMDQEELKRQEDLSMFAQLLAERKHQPPAETNVRPQQSATRPENKAAPSAGSGSLKPKQTSKQVKRLKKKSNEKSRYFCAKMYGFTKKENFDIILYPHHNICMRLLFLLHSLQSWHWENPNVRCNKGTWRNESISNNSLLWKQCRHRRSSLWDQ
jgi:hypothetical protein